MKKTKFVSFRTFLCVFLALLLSLSIFTVPAYAVEKNEDIPKITVQQIEETFKENSPKEYQKFKSLSKEEQKEFADILSNPSRLFDSEDPNSPVEIKTEIVSEKQLSVENTYPLSIQPYYYGQKMIGKIVGYKTSISLFGLALLTYSSDIEYRYTDGVAVTCYVRTASWVNLNLNPLVKTELLSTRKSTGSTGEVQFVYSYKIGPLKGLSVQIGTLLVTYRLYNNGTFSANIYRE